MRALGYPKTWPTTCFLRPNECQQSVFGHTNGFGDFVMFDELGWPWPVHSCYEERYVIWRSAECKNTVALEISREAAKLEISQVFPSVPVKSQNITKVDPKEFVGQGEIVVFGYVQEYHERQALQVMAKLGTFGQQVLRNALQRRLSQLTIVTDDFRSLTVFADLSNIVVQRTNVIAATIRAISVPGIRNLNAFLIADHIMIARQEK